MDDFTGDTLWAVFLPRRDVAVDEDDDNDDECGEGADPSDVASKTDESPVNCCCWCLRWLDPDMDVSLVVADDVMDGVNLDANKGMEASSV